MLDSAGKRVAEQGQLQFLAERRERLDIPDGCRQKIPRARRNHRKREVFSATWIWLPIYITETISVTSCSSELIWVLVQSFTKAHHYLSVLEICCLVSCIYLWMFMKSWTLLIIFSVSLHVSDAYINVVFILELNNFTLVRLSRIFDLHTFSMALKTLLAFPSRAFTSSSVLYL